MKVKKENSIKIKLTGDKISRFRGVLQKMENMGKSVGFKGEKFDEKEVKLIKDLIDKTK